MEKTQSVFKTLSSINLSSKVEKRGNLSYISWSTAWGAVKEHYPDVQRTVFETENGVNYFTDGMTAFVKVGVTINNIEHLEYLPIMDIRNASIRLDKITSFDVNKAIQRCTVKALALHGLALNIYNKEEFFDEPKAVAPKASTKVTLVVGDANWEKVVNYVVDNIGLKSEDVFKNLSKKYELSDQVKAAINKLKK
jgi:Protein of unknown function (DUF1071)